MVALELDLIILDRAAGATDVFETGRKFVQLVRIGIETTDDRDKLAFGSPFDRQSRCLLAGRHAPRFRGHRRTGTFRFELPTTLA